MMMTLDEVKKKVYEVINAQNPETRIENVRDLKSVLGKDTCGNLGKPENWFKLLQHLESHKEKLNNLCAEEFRGNSEQLKTEQRTHIYSKRCVREINKLFSNRQVRSFITLSHGIKPTSKMVHFSGLGHAYFLPGANESKPWLAYGMDSKESNGFHSSLISAYDELVKVKEKLDMR